MPQAGQTTTGGRPRRSNRRHSFSIGDRKPPITGTPASRIARARSYIVRMTSPGRRPEQNRAVRSAWRMDMPMVKRESALTRPCVKRRQVRSWSVPSKRWGCGNGLLLGRRRGRRRGLASSPRLWGHTPSALICSGWWRCRFLGHQSLSIALHPQL